MRLDLFVPAHTCKQHPVMRTFRRLAPTWAASPARRIVQTLCFVVFTALFFYVSWPYGGRNYTETLAAKEWIPAEIFLALDPLVSISTAIAARMWVWSLAAAAAVLAVCLIFPRGFCGYICPMGTFLDLFDWALGRHVSKPRARPEAWWSNLRYAILATLLIAAAFGVLLSGFVAAIAVWTRAVLFIAGPAQTALLKGRHLVPPMNAGYWLSLALFAAIIATCFIERRFWCKYLCPTGAMFSLGAMLSLTRRKVTTACTNCGRCKPVCDFGAIREDFTTRRARCSFCQTCGGVCPSGAIQFADHWTGSKQDALPPQEAATCTRRSLFVQAGAAAAAGIALPAAIGKVAPGEPPVRAPGSVPEQAFLQLCVRCGQCIKACPNNVLQPAGLENGLNGLWAPRVLADWSGCDPTCTNCGQVCPTGAIRALPLAEKQAARMALAIVDKQTCLPHAGRDECRYCVDECTAAGYNAIEFVRVGGRLDEAGRPIENSGFLAPVVLEDKCVGCGLCQMRCRAMNVKNDHLLNTPAITIHAGPNREDRLLTGYYLNLRRQRQAAEKAENSTDNPSQDYLPDFLR